MKKHLFKELWMTVTVGCLFAVMTGACASKNGVKEVEASNDSVVAGLDVSQYQGHIEWKQLSLNRNCIIGSAEYFKDKNLKEDVPVQFVFVRATKSNCVTDANFRTNFEEAKNNNILRGAYHFLIDSVSGTKQAEHFLSVANLEKGDLPPVLDIEKDTKNGKTIELKVSVDQWRKIAKEWLDVVEKHYGVKAIIYTNLNGYNNWIKDDKVLCDHDIWIAKPRGAYNELPENWRFWQFTHKGHATGITENEVDMNLFNGNIDSLKQYVAEKGIKE